MTKKTNLRDAIGRRVFIVGATAMAALPGVPVDQHGRARSGLRVRRWRAVSMNRSATLPITTRFGSTLTGHPVWSMWAQSVRTVFIASAAPRAKAVLSRGPMPELNRA